MTPPALDPALRLILRGALSLLFAAAALHKLRDVGAFRTAFERYEIVPPAWSIAVAALLLGSEIGIAVALWLPRVGTAAALGAAALLLVYAAAIAVNLRRGRRDIDCGCAGPARRQPISGVLVVRNVVLAGLAIASVWPAGVRPLGWVDGLTIGAALVALSCLYTAAEGLLAAAARARVLEPAHG